MVLIKALGADVNLSLNLTGMFIYLPRIQSARLAVLKAKGQSICFHSWIHLLRKRNKWSNHASLCSRVGIAVSFANSQFPLTLSKQGSFIKNGAKQDNILY